VKLDVIIEGPLEDAGRAAARAEEVGCDGIMIPEVAHDPFLPMTIAATSTQHIRLATGIAVAFARNPMNVAVMASDLHRLSGGRFALGLGSQIKPHITRRYSMPWSQPVARMREFVAAVRAIWATWEDGGPLDFEGDYYRHTLMTPMFSHGPSPCGWPSIHLAAVGPMMTALAGEIADGLNTHGFTTAGYVRDVTLVHLALGLARGGRDRGEVEISVPVMYAIVDGDDDPAIDRMRATIGFYGSTPAYRPVLEHHGQGALGEELHRLSRKGAWEMMPTLVTDDVLHEFAVIGDERTVAREIAARYGGIVDRIQLGTSAGDARFPSFVDELRAVLRSRDDSRDHIESPR
jgi:probable F420-dependent oxidoreductase